MNDHHHHDHGTHFHHHGFDDLGHLLWHEGGCVMLPLFLVAMWIGYMAVDMLIFFTRSPLKNPKSDRWNLWINSPQNADGEAGKIIRFTQSGDHSYEDIHRRFVEVADSIIPWISGRIQFMTILVTSAPLLGLLGTVFGMLKTFSALGVSAGDTLERISLGISEALITTQTGLLIALPGYLAIYLVQRKRNQLQAFLAHLECITLQRFQRNTTLAHA